ncbi:MAG: hypothetical protein ACT4P6_12955 [Gemmatimonadaceae bacterium]
MTRRGVLAIGIVLAWVLGIAAFTRRELARNDSERLAESALRVAPGATYFAVLRDGKHIGYASTTIDTLPARIQVTDYLVSDVQSGDSLRRHTMRTRVRLTRGLMLREFLVQQTTDSTPLLMRGRVLNDSVLDFVVRSATGSRGRTIDSVRTLIQGHITAVPLIPVVTMLGGPSKVGRSAPLTTFDPTSGALRQTVIRLAAESLFVVSDSAMYDGSAAKWRSVHNDSVRAWRLDGVAGALWADALGRPVRHERPDGIVLQRTAYELAFENWRVTSPLRSKGNASPSPKP